MPISAPGTCSSRGFTLIELLVVLLVMGLCAGLVVAIAHPDERVVLRVEAERLAHLLDLAALESRMSGRPVAWSVAATAEGTRYRFSRWRDDAGWAEATANDPAGDSLRERRLPTGMTITHLRVEAAQPGDTRLEFSPHWPLAYDFRLSLGAAHYEIASSAVGEVRIHASP